LESRQVALGREIFLSLVRYDDRAHGAAA
jgi:hypothetical protein